MNAQPVVETVNLLRQLDGDSAIAVTAPIVEGRLGAAQLQLIVDGVGPLSAPASPTEVSALATRCQPAPFGLGTQTLVDVAVRDTGEIDAAAVALTWSPGAEASLCGEIARGLGLPQVELKLHKLLCYGKGQFFKTHQDTARQAGMVGTLILIWPGSHIGGTLKLRHRNRTHRFDSQQLADEEAIRWCAFYADCQHEVLPVIAGHRLALSFEVLVPVAKATSLPQPPANAPLSAALARVFAAASPDAPARPRPWFLLLDHQYNNHNLRWSSLKGRDRKVALALRAAAQANGFTIELALLEQTDIWDCAGRKAVEFDDWYDDEDETAIDEIPATHSAREFDPRSAPESALIDRTHAVNSWVGPDDQIDSGRQGMMVNSSDIASLRPTGAVHLVEQEYEGYMGNYGDTMSYWYRRAVLVVQSPTVALRLRYQTGLPQALRELAQRASDPALEEGVRAEAEVVADLLEQGVSNRPWELLPALFEVAAILSPDTAARLLAPLHHAALSPEDVPALRQLELTHGPDWLRTQLKSWTAHRDPYWSRQRPEEPDHAPPWPEPLDQFFVAAAQHGLSPTLLTEWQAQLLAQFQRDEATWKSSSPASRRDRLAQRLRWLQRLLGALCVDTGSAAAALLDQAIGMLRSSTRLYPLLAQAGLLSDVMATTGAPAPPVITAWHLALTQAIDEALGLPARAVDDQGLRDVEWVCRCTLCAGVIQWAESSTGGLYRVAVAEPLRQHISQRVHASAAPIRTETLKQGRPYSLICHKQGDAALRDQQAHQALILARVRLQALGIG